LREIRPESANLAAREMAERGPACGYDGRNERRAAVTVLTMRLVMGILFLLLAGLMFGRRWLMPDLDARYDPLRMNLGAVLALVFGGLNLARWYAVWSYRRAKRTPVRTPLQPDPSVRPPVVPHPELDFTKSDEMKAEEPRTSSASGGRQPPE
jgi:hypothetical protein